MSNQWFFCCFSIYIHNNDLLSMRSSNLCQINRGWGVIIPWGGGGSENQRFSQPKTKKCITEYKIIFSKIISVMWGGVYLAIEGTLYNVFV